MRDNIELIDERDLSLDEWLELIKIPLEERDYRINDFQFPTDAHRDEYLETVAQRSDQEIKLLASYLLIDGGWLGCDENVRSSLSYQSRERFEYLIENSLYLNRVAIPQDDHPPWASILWIVDLLPRFPQEAISALNAYFQAHYMYMPDGFINGLSDVESIIKAKYMRHALPAKQTLLDLTSRDFELLVGYLYVQKGYDVTVTPRACDGGYDILAQKNSMREEETLLIECKRYEQNVGVAIVRQVLGVLNIQKATKVVIVTSAKFTKTAIKESRKSKRAELIDIDSFDRDMRKFVSYSWINNVDRYISDMKRNNVKIY